MELGELWIDKEDIYKSKINDFTGDLKYNLEFFHEKGYVIFRNLINDDLISGVLEDLKNFFQRPERFILKRLGNYVKDESRKSFIKADRVVDLYGFSENTRKIIANKYISDFLIAIFEELPIAMQSIYFEYGSQQSIHQDTAYVISSKPLSLAACWIALEDVSPDAGGLAYYPGSHRFPHYFFGGNSKGYRPNLHGKDSHQTFLNGLHEKAKAIGSTLETFSAKKGDVLFWHADLAHGGGKILDDNLTRKSLVIHFCPQSVKPNYKNVIKDKYHELKYNDMLFASRHYDFSNKSSNNEFNVLYNPAYKN